MSQTINDFLNNLRQYHNRLEKYYKSMAGSSENQRVKMFLDHLSDWEKQRILTLTRFEESLPKLLYGSELRFQPSEDVLNIQLDSLPDNLINKDIDDLIELAVNLNQRVLDLYRQMIDADDSTGINGFFENLLKTESRSQRELVRDAQELKDL